MPVSTLIPPRSLSLMVFYRDYPRPGGAPGFELFDEAPLDLDNGKYSAALKAACKKGAGPRPRAPKTCPRCGAEATRFYAGICYKVGFAGAWRMVVSGLMRTDVCHCR